MLCFHAYMHIGLHAYMLSSCMLSCMTPKVGHAVEFAFKTHIPKGSRPYRIGYIGELKAKLETALGYQPED